MYCKSCHTELENYPDRRLGENMNNQIKSHLEICKDCAELYRIEALADRVITFEKRISPDNKLVSNIITRIEKEEEIGINGTSRFISLLKPVLITTSVAAAIFAGVLMGNIYKPSSREIALPVELALIDDDAIESVFILSNQ